MVGLDGGVRRTPVGGPPRGISAVCRRGLTAIRPAGVSAAAGADGFVFEVHPEPERALCDGPNSLPLNKLPELLDQLQPLCRTVRELPDLSLE